MKVKFDSSALSQTRWYEYSLRFLVGGAITVIAGLLADRFGPEIGGLFLAFPAVFPASVTLIEKHEREKKLQAGYDPGNRPRFAVLLEALGATMGSAGLIAFSLFASLFLPKYSSVSVLTVAFLVWFLVSISLWKTEDSI